VSQPSFSLDDVRHIAELARIGVPEDRLPVLAREISGILEHMSVLQGVDLSRVAGAAELPDTPWRADHGPAIPLLRALADFAPEVRDGFLIVPRLATHGGTSPGEDSSRGSADEEIEDQA
jgi:aspartyl-tRNA(Asn)/glutamyl-tRNA(Gln) amidotransferase subunit C